MISDCTGDHALTWMEAVLKSFAQLLLSYSYRLFCLTVTHVFQSTKLKPKTQQLQNWKQIQIPVTRFCKLPRSSFFSFLFFFLSFLTQDSLDFIVYIPANLQTSRFSLSATDIIEHVMTKTDSHKERVIEINTISVTDIYTTIYIIIYSYFFFLSFCFVFFFLFQIKATYFFHN